MGLGALEFRKGIEPWILVVEVDDEAGEKILRLVNALEDNEDVQNVYANFEVDDETMAKLSAA